MKNYKTISQDEEHWEDDSTPFGQSSLHSALSTTMSLRNAPLLFPAEQLSSKLVPAEANSSGRSEASGDTKTTRSAAIVYILIYGVVNSIMGIPAMYGYAAVIFNNPAFNSYTNELSKVVLWSSVVHQVCFVAFSSLPFAIGQVQDAGLIFLCHMANTMANKITSEGGSQEEIMSTCLVILTMATFSTGIVLMLMGKFRLADLVSYLPLPVVGGYLACKWHLSLSRCTTPYSNLNNLDSTRLQLLVIFADKLALRSASPNP
jgi:hypothetical protein